MKADNKKTLNRLKRIQGQVNAIIKMIEEDKYCMDISIQILAVVAALKSANKEIVSAHLRSCLKEAFEIKDNYNIDEKIKEIESLLLKIN